MTQANRIENVKPKLQLLGPEQMNQVHQYSIRILEKTGIKVESKTALEIYKKSNAVRIKNDVVFIQGELIDYAIRSAPSGIDIFNQAGEIAFRLGKEQGDETYFGIGVTNTNFQDIESGRIEPFTRKHMQHCTKLGDMLRHYDMISTIGVPSDVPVDQLDLISTLDMLANTSKPLVLLIEEGERIQHVFDLISYLHGNISKTPFCIPYVNPVTPLVMNASTTDKMIASINQQLPLMYSNYSMYGGTSPKSEGGSLALLNAELLAGLVFSQLIREGSKIILGSLPAAFNMRSMGSTYTPSSYLLNLACAEMMSFYKIPHCGTSGSGNGWGADLSASGDLWLNHLSSCIGKIGCAPFVGGNFDSMVFSPQVAVLSDHIIEVAKQFANGFSLNDEQVSLSEIDQVGHGGNYLTSAQTLASLSEASSETPPIWPSLNLESWRAQNMPKAGKFLIDYTRDLYARAMRASDQNSEIIQMGEDYIDNAILR